MDNIKVLHIDTERGWRGGQQQGVYLFEAMIGMGYETAFVCKPNSKLSRYFTSNKLPFINVKMSNEFDIISAYKIAKFCKQNSYNILHLHSGHALAIGIFTKLFYRNLKIIGVRRVDFSINKNWISKFKYTNRLINSIIAISNNIKNVLIQDGVSEKNITTIRSGIDIHKFDNIIANKSIREEFAIPKDAIIVGTVAALVDHKDYPNLLNAASVVLNKHKNVYFIAAGNGKEENEIKSLANSLNLGKNFIFLGYRENIGEILKAMDIFVLVSKMEGLGTSTIDAMAVGLPVIGTNAGGIPEVIEHGYNGLVVPKQNSTELALAIIDLVEDVNKRKVFGVNSLERVKQYSIDKTVSNNLKLYKSLINN